MKTGKSNNSLNFLSSNLCPPVANTSFVSGKVTVYEAAVGSIKAKRTMLGWSCLTPLCRGPPSTLCWHRQHPQQQHPSNRATEAGSAGYQVQSPGECTMAERTCSMVWVWRELRWSSQLRRWRLVRAFRGCWWVQCPHWELFLHNACEKAHKDFSLHKCPWRLGESSRALWIYSCLVKMRPPNYCLTQPMESPSQFMPFPLILLFFPLLVFTLFAWPDL